MTLPSSGRSSARRRRVSDESWFVCIPGRYPVGYKPVMGAFSRGERLILAVVAVLTAAAGVMNYSGAAGLPTFGVAALALAGLAWIVSFATEQVGARFGP